MKLGGYTILSRRTHHDKNGAIPTTAGKDRCIIVSVTGNHYLKMHVYHDKLPISIINKVFDAEGKFPEEQMKVCIAQVEGFLRF